MKFLRFLLLMLFIIIFIQHVSLADSNWWNEDWKYRTQIVIISGEDFPYGTTINITLDTTDMINKGVMKSDCSDVRFVNSTSNYLYNFSVLLCNSSKTIFTIKMLHGFRNDSINEIYMYYGNPNAKKISKDFNEIYWNYFEDFNNCSGDCDWRDESSFQKYNNGNITFLPYDGCYEESNVFVLNGGKENWWKTVKCWSPNNLDTYKIEVLFDVKVFFGTPSIIDIWVADDNKSTSRFYSENITGVGLQSGWESTPRPTICSRGFCERGNKTNILYSEWNHLRFITNSTGVYTYLNRNIYTLERNISLVNNSSPWKIVLKYNEGDGRDFEYIYIDNFGYRYKPDKEPIIYILPEEINENLVIGIHRFFADVEGIELNIDIKDNKNNFLYNLSQNNFNVSVDDSAVDVTGFQNLGNGSYKIGVDYDSNVLGEKELKVNVRYGNYSGSNTTSFYWLLDDRRRKDFIVVSDDDWRNVVAASVTGLPVLIGNADLTGENVSGVFVLGDVNVSGFNGDVYKVDRDTLQKMYLGEGKIFVDDKKRGVLASRLACEWNRTIVFDDCSGDCVDLSKETIKEIEDMYTGETNYFILVNENRDNFLLAAPLSVYRKGLPIFVDVGEVHYPELPEDVSRLDEYNRENGINDTRESIKEKIENFVELKKEYVFGEMPKLAIIGSESDIPFFLVKDMGLEDIVREPSGDELWLKTDNFYGDLNSDGFQDLAVGRINKGLEDGSRQLFEVREFEKRKNKEAGVLAEYNHILGMDLLNAGGSMLNGFMAETKLRNNFETDRLVEHRFYITDEKIEDKMIKDIFEILMKILKLGKFKGAISKLVFSQKLLYILLERNWIGWQMGTVPPYIQEISKELSEDFLNEKDIVFFFGPGDTNRMFFYDDMGKDRDLVSEPYPGPELDIRNIEKTGFLFLDYSFSAFGDATEKSPGIIGNTGLLHDMASRESIMYFLKNMDWGAGQALAESKNEIYGALRYRHRENVSRPYVKEVFEKVLLSDPGLEILSAKKPHKGFYCAERYKDKFMDSVEINPEYEIQNGNIIFSNYSLMLMEPNKPMVPVYTKSIVIPSGAKIDDIKIEKHQKTIENVTIPLFRDEYYEGDNFSGIYPKEEWWKNEKSFLDGRKEIIFSVPVRYDGRNAIINDFNFDVFYNSSLEITKFYTTSVVKGEKQNFYLDLYSNGEREAEIFLKIYGFDELSKNITLEKGENEIIFDWNDTSTPGEYTAEVVVVSDVVIGPRATKFRIFRKPDFFSMVTGSIIQVWKNIGMKFTRVFESNKTELRNTTPSMETSSWIEDGKRITEMKSSEFDLKVIQSSDERILKFNSPLGEIIIRESNGTREEKIYGDPKVREQFSTFRKKFKDKIEGMR